MGCNIFIKKLRACLVKMGGGEVCDQYKHDAQYSDQREDQNGDPSEYAEFFLFHSENL